MMLSIRQLEIGKKVMLNKIAIYLNKCFSSFFRPVSEVNIDQICIFDMELWDIEVSVDEARDHLKNLDTAASMEKPFCMFTSDE